MVSNLVADMPGGMVAEIPRAFQTAVADVHAARVTMASDSLLHLFAWARTGSRANFATGSRITRIDVLPGVELLHGRLRDRRV